MGQGEPNREPNFEEKEEHAPTFEEVVSLIKEIVGEKECREDRKLEDEKGVYLLELVIVEEGGTKTEYSYRRKGKSSAGDALSCVINVTYYDADGMPVGGRSVADFIEGKWIKPTR